jgi:hypothetical protein
MKHTHTFISRFVPAKPLFSLSEPNVQPMLCSCWRSVKVTDSQQGVMFAFSQVQGLH